jgi:uncharacterized membrane protein YjgN (DUF898 family)
MHEPDYSRYSIDELEQALTGVDRRVFPDRARRIERELARRAAVPGTRAERPRVVRGEEWTERPSFTGDGREYFGIWIVNLLLTVVTLGFFLPWALVRSRKYLYRHTHLAGHSFDYVAEPRRLLAGYLIVAVFVGLFFAFPYLHPLLAIVAAVAFVGFGLSIPWLLYKSIRFFLANSTYRNLRFRFEGTAGDSYIYYMVLPPLISLSLGLAVPWYEKVRREYFYDNVRYGSLRSSATLDTRFFYIVLFGGALLVGLVFLLVTKALVPVSVALGGQGGGPGAEVQSMWAFLPIAPVYLLVFCFGIFAAIKLTDHCWNGTRFEAGHGDRALQVSLRSRISGARYVWIVLQNVVLTVVTLGIFTPFAIVRLYRYRVSRVEVSGHGSLDDVIAVAEDDPDAVGESAADVFDLDFGF